MSGFSFFYSHIAYLAYSYRANGSGRQVMCVGTERTAAEIKANENAFAIFMAAMMFKYGPEVLKELQVEQKKSAK